MSLTRIKNVALAATAVLCLTGSYATTSALALSASSQAPDNSSQNKGHTETADSQPNLKTDRETTAKIRKAIVGDKNLSTYAHNVKVITVNGQVTLKGAVQTDEEKQKVGALAANIVSPDKVINDLTAKQ
jgi:hyperosmotically inducible periplasmic protein